MRGGERKQSKKNIIRKINRKSTNISAISLDDNNSEFVTGREEGFNELKEIEYDNYLNIKEIFTVLALIGCPVLDEEMEENIKKSLEDKLIDKIFLDEKNFIENQFWFEKEFEYLQRDFVNNDESSGIKNFLFNIWKNEKNLINIEEFFNVLKNSRYVTEIKVLNESKYYNIIFDNN